LENKIYGVPIPFPRIFMGFGRHHKPVRLTTTVFAGAQDIVVPMGDDLDQG